MNAGFDHITPYYYTIDESAHVDNASCWCVPDVEDYGDGFIVVTHNTGVC